MLRWRLWNTRGEREQKAAATMITERAFTDQSAPASEPSFASLFRRSWGDMAIQYLSKIETFKCGGKGGGFSLVALLPVFLGLIILLLHVNSPHFEVCWRTFLHILASSNVVRCCWHFRVVMNVRLQGDECKGWKRYWGWPCSLLTKVGILLDDLLSFLVWILICLYNHTSMHACIVWPMHHFPSWAAVGSGINSEM